MHRITTCVVVGGAALALAALAACGSGSDDGGDGAAGAAGAAEVGGSGQGGAGGSSVGGSTSIGGSGGVGCGTDSECALVQDCRCKDGTETSGRGCVLGQCLGRNAACDQFCGSHGGWIPNPEGCWEWSLSELAGPGENYKGSQSGCLSGAKITVWKPGQNELSWCIPQEQCASDSECPTAATSVTGVDWRCHVPVTGANTGNPYRLCMDQEETLCNMK